MVALHCRTPNYHKPGLFKNAVLEVRNHTIELDSLLRVSWDGKKPCWALVWRRVTEDPSRLASLLASLSFLLQQRTILLVDCQLGASLIPGPICIRYQVDSSFKPGNFTPFLLVLLESLPCVAERPCVGQTPCCYDKHQRETVKQRRVSFTPWFQSMGRWFLGFGPDASQTIIAKGIRWN